MSQHINLGNIALPVGSYLPAGAKADAKPKKRFRNIGTLMQSTDSEGTRYWIKLNADILHASLFALVRGVDTAKGDDTVTARVFEPRDPSKPAAKDAEGEPDEGPF